MADRKNFYYTKEHEWVEKITDDTVRVGITEHAAEQLGDIVFVDFVAELDAELAKGDEAVTVESVKSVSEVYAPVSGTVIKQNETLADAPETVNAEAFAGGWMYEMRLSNTSELDELLSYDEYEAFVAEEEA
ncbi:glycine cleavage system protein GcvH [Trichococcus collinsii]|uniref:Glycine cleavage system H protein n=1 Tax=Trichococcus collinsii TaxID=157076 RepID=A0AB37ZY82_9LACT|nr:glycine cleavage system protein GcvH [Trichococcus collinsii]CZR09281.1 glycine cleavage system h-protein [Trichococcus collinsii]SEA16464.1 glycine cleavage system H protein [Trichococcus collinsii]